MTMTSDNETLLPASWHARPRGFASLMALYESNYLRLARLVGDPALLSGERVSHVAGGCDLKLNVLEQCPYTTTLGLTHLFHDPRVVGPGLETFLTYPDVRIRVYGDARMPRPSTGAWTGPSHTAVIRPKPGVNCGIVGCSTTC